MSEITRETPTSSQGSLSLDPQGVIIRFGPDLGPILGYGHEDVVGRPLDVFAPTGLDRDKARIFADASCLTRAAYYTTRMLRKDGAEVEIYASVYPIKDYSDEVYTRIVVLSTLSPPETPAILFDEFRRIFLSSNETLVVTDKDGSIIDANQNFLDSYGYSMDEVLGKNPRILKSDHTTPEIYERMWKDLLDPSRGFWRGEIINKASDGREVPVMLSINAIRDNRGVIKNFLGIATDLSRQKEMDRLNRMYIDYIVHDMRNPLTAIMANSELLLSQLDSDAPEEVRRKLEVTLNCAKRLNSMTSDILDYSRAQGGSLTVNRTSVRLNHIVNDALLPFRSTRKRFLVNGFDSSEHQVGDLEIEADADKLERVIYNLLGNAFKHASSEVRLSVEDEGDWIKFTVSDDGKGFSRTEAERIFEPFYQTDDGVRTGGAGLGLNIVKSFVEALGGKVWVESDKGSGATFSVIIPRKAGGCKNGT